LPILTQKDFCLVGDTFYGGAVVSYPVTKETRDDSVNVCLGKGVDIGMELGALEENEKCGNDRR